MSQEHSAAVPLLEGLSADGIRVIREGASTRAARSPVKVVHKHWGSEQWLLPEGRRFACKAIFIRAGCRTSLQLHRVKEEVNVVVHGRGVLFCDERDEVGIPLSVGSVIHVEPGAVHRIAAETDLVMVEASTPELDDVVRLQDDAGRPDGRIASEHGVRR
jgi:mannose-6-phosphate isomerase-like protein (cupin superfamily)